MEQIVGGLIDWFMDFCLSISGCGAKDLYIDVNADQLGTIIKAIWNMLAPFAMTLTAAYCLVDLNKKMVFEGTDVNIKTLGFPIIKFMVANIVISNGLLIFDGLVSMSNSMIKAVEQTITNKGIEDHVGEEIAKALGFWGLIIVVLPLLIALVISLVCKLVWIYKGFAYKVEFIARYMFAPIALADVYSGTNTAALRYIKGTVAFILYGVCLVVLPKLVNVVAVQQIVDTCGDLLKDGVNNFGDVLGIISNMLIVIVAPIAAIGIVGAAKSITREALGA